MEEKPKNEIISLDALTLWGETGRIVVSIKNGFPRFTFFKKKENSDDRTVYTTAPMSLSGFLVVASCIDAVVASKEDLKYSLVCKNKDYDSNAVIVQAILVVARVGKDIVLGLKRDANSKADYAKFDLGMYLELFKGDASDVDVSSEGRATAFASYIRHAVDKASRMINPKKPSIPNHKREGSTYTKLESGL